MATNNLITPQMIASEALMQFKNSLRFTKGANRQYSKEFAQKGAKIGNTINVRKPQRFTVTDGAPISKQNINNETVSLVLNKRKHVAFEFSTQELTLSIDKFSETYVTPAAQALANQVDIDGLSQALSVSNAVGTPGTTLTSIDQAIDAGVLLDNFGCPVGDRSIILNPKNQGGVVKGSKSLFQSTEQIGQQYEKGVMGIAAGFKWYMGQNVYMHQVGALGGTPLVNGAAQTGTNLIVDGFTASAAPRLKKGDVFTIAGVYAVNPITFQNTGELQQFVATADVSSDGAGAATIPIFPALSISGTSRTVTALPADNAAITVLGAANTVTPLGLAYHKDAFMFGCADLEMPKGVDMSAYARDEESGLSIRFVRFYDGDADQLVSRLDVLYGWLAANPQWATRVQG